MTAFDLQPMPDLGAAEATQHGARAAHETGSEEHERVGLGRHGRGAVEVEAGGVEVSLMHLEVEEVIAGRDGEGEGVGSDAVGLIDGALGEGTGAFGDELGQIIEVNSGGVVGEHTQGDRAAVADKVDLVVVVAVGCGNGATGRGVWIEGDVAASGQGSGPDAAGADIEGGRGGAIGREGGQRGAVAGVERGGGAAGEDGGGGDARESEGS